MLHNIYTSPLLGKYGPKLVHWNNKKEVSENSKWLAETYPTRISEIKEGDIFLVWNGDSTPVPFVMITDEQPDTRKRPTRLLDGCYYSLTSNTMLRIITPEEAAQIKKEIKSRY